MPLIWPMMAVGAHLMLVADRVPQFDFRASCHTAVEAAVAPGRNEDSCGRDEQQARAKLEQEWSGFAAAERVRCTDLSSRGGPPSYVELLTCLELAKQAKNLPPGDKMGGDIGR